MNQFIILPNRCKKIGLIILGFSSVLGLLVMFNELEFSWLDMKTFALVSDTGLYKHQYFKFNETNLTNTIVGLFCIIGALMVGFSREKREDEYIRDTRLSALLWAVAVNYILLFFAFLLIYDTAFLSVMVYNMFTILLLFIIRFHYVLYRNSKSVSDEKFN